MAPSTCSPRQDVLEAAPLMDCTGSTPGVGEKVERLLRLGRQRRGSGGVEI